MRKRSQPNPKRRLLTQESFAVKRDIYLDQAALVQYGGNPAHKRNPGDFGLEPPGPRQGKTLCDGVGIFSKKDALELLQEGMKRGLVSEQHRNDWPQNIWAVAPNGVCLEAMLDNKETGSYHGYPLLGDDPLNDAIKRHWNENE